ncbi:MAG: selenocysteine-specific translation elongation factor [Tissierellia bacterium]|jgi:selenocysteine-specific elongation factor|nr:selenocysteine-specific translation elongation factor [Tissierellia bacterium]
MRNIIIGTAGHIDHGKTTLIKALTGRETDRWEEEKRRGITIDLGFTYFDLPDGSKAGIIDVPGHEKFIKNMLAGVVGMDMVLLVIAADEGIMPQTTEHLNILNLLGVENGIVVLTKCDMAEKEWISLVKEDIAESLRSTFLEGAPIVEVSSKTGYGINNLIQEINSLAEKSVRERELNTIARLPIDRVFSITGFGTVITGTLITGILKKGDEVEIYPVNKLCKIRNIQVHSSDAEKAYAGQRTAINLSNVKKTDIYRGCVIAPVNSMKNTKMLDVKLNLLKNSKRVVINRSRLHFYTGTSEILARVVLLDRDELTPGESCYAQLRLEDEIAVRRGDKFIVRFYSPLETIGGGEIIEPVPKKRKRFDENLIEELKVKEKGTGADVIEKIIKEARELISVSLLAKTTALTETEVKDNIEILEQEEKISLFTVKNEKYVWHKSYEIEIEEKVEKYLFTYHKENKYAKGAKKSEIKSKFLPALKQVLFDVVIQSFCEKGLLKLVDEFIFLPYFSVEYDEDYMKIKERALNIINDAEFEFLKTIELAEKINHAMTDDVISLMITEEDLFKLNDLITTMELYEEAKKILIEFLNKNERINAAQYRDLLNTNRKTAIALLEHFDMIKLTKRVENDRILLNLT